MIIKTQTPEETKIVRKLRDFVQQATGERLHLVPFGVESMFVTVNLTEDQEKITDFVLYLENDSLDIGTEVDEVSGFQTPEECWDYARVVAKEAGLSEDCIDSDICSAVEEHGRNEEESNMIYMIVSLIQNYKDNYEVHGQGFNEREEMKITAFGSFETLEEAREEAEYVAASYDCPLVEMIKDDHPRMRDLVKELD